MKKTIFNPWHGVCVLAVASVLAGCDPSPVNPQAAQTPAVQGESQPVPAPSGAVEGMTADAALVAQSAEKAAASSLEELKQYVGTYPSTSSVNFLEQGVLADRLKQVLGNDYTIFLSNMRTVSPLTEDAGRWFITGNRPHEGGMGEAAVVIDAAQNAVRVWMLHDGKVTEWLDPQGANVPWPKDVQTMVDNQKSKS